MRRISLSLALLALLLPPAAGFAAAGGVADAAMNRDFTGLQALIGLGVDVNAPQADGTTALHWAVHFNNLEAMDLLIAAGADPKASTRLGATPLYLAALNGSAPAIAKLLAAGADPDTTGLAYGETPLMFAARSGSVDSVRVLLDAGAEMETKETLRGTTALIWASEQNQAAVAAFLLSRGADPQIGTTVSIPAGRGGQAQADADDGDDAGQAVAAPAAAQGGGDAAPEFPANARGGITPLIFAAREGAIDTVKVLLEGGAPVNQRAADGATALLIAVQNGQIDLARLLIEQGADPSLANGRGWTPLYLAVKSRTPERGTMPNPSIDADDMFDFIRLIIEKGADVNARVRSDTEVRNAIRATWLRETGGTAFIRAAMGGDLEVMKLLLANGADPLIATNDGTTALMALAGVGFTKGFMEDIGGPEESIEAMKLLISLGIDIHAKTTDSVMAIHGAAHKNFVEGIQLLVDSGADLTAISQRRGQFGGGDLEGNTVLDWADGFQTGMESAIYNAEAVELVERLLTERNLPLVRYGGTPGGRVVQAEQ